MHKVDSIDRRRSVTLIGMAGVGKSTIGHLLAQRLGRAFVDTDDLIRGATGQSLQSLIQQNGLDGFLAKEAEVIGSMAISDMIIATGGSAVYGETAMAHLKQHSWVVWLQQDQSTIIERIGHLPGQRGLAMRRGQSIADVIVERNPLYARYEDFSIQCGDQSPEAIVDAIIDSLKLVH